MNQKKNNAKHEKVQDLVSLSKPEASILHCDLYRSYDPERLGQASDLLKDIAIVGQDRYSKQQQATRAVVCLLSIQTGLGLYVHNEDICDQLRLLLWTTI